MPMAIPIDPLLLSDPSSPSKFHQDQYNSNTARKRLKHMPGGPATGTDFNEDDKAHRSSQSTPRGRGGRGGRGRPSLDLSGRPRRRMPSQDKPTYNSAQDAVSAVDGYKPREERSWEEFHPELDIDDKLVVFSADQVDGTLKDNETGSPASLLKSIPSVDQPVVNVTPIKRKPGRPPRKPESMLNGLGSPPTPKIVPLPSQNPRERLNLPKPSFRKIETFLAYEADSTYQINYVDRTMANVGYQESEMYLRPARKFIRLSESAPDDDLHRTMVLESDASIDKKAAAEAPTITRVEYDMDEQDEQWLDLHNSHRKREEVEPIKPAIFEITMTQIEKEWHALERRIPKPNPKPPQTHRPRSSSAAAVNGEPPPAGEEQDSKCAICDDGDCENTNAIVFCDGCDLAVHQECYGVPFIPEGQWLCRKCQLVGRNSPTCIFCPNIDGAFKLTNESRWAHLICAIWIPEVSLGNITFMEPIQDVARVPKQRWKLNCYICNQKMGACIQCGNRNCFQAFHVTCARRAKLFLKMKGTHGGPANFDASFLKAFCDKHVPSEWRREHGVDTAIVQAKIFYRRNMRNRRWADSQQAALAMMPSNLVQSSEPTEDPTNEATSGAANAQKRKRLEAQKHIWRLPSGAPVIPHVVFTAIESTLQRFSVRKRKDFVAEACKYWTLKREARRGAALLKRLQLQMETFSSTEITRRNFSAMGAAGRPRLQRRIAMADQLLRDMKMLKQMCHDIEKREATKLEDAELLRSMVDTVYFPIATLLEPILEKAQKLDSRGMFLDGFKTLQNKLDTRAYTSVSSFSTDLGSIFRSVVGLDKVNDALEAHNQLSGMARDANLTADQKQTKTLAKRIIKAVQQPLQEAARMEAELSGRPFEQELERLEGLLNVGLTGSSDLVSTVKKTNDDLPMLEGGSIDVSDMTPVEATNNNGVQESKPQSTVNTDAEVSGIPWYLIPFDPSGTTIYQERWDGRDVMRDLSEELSEMDEEDLQGMGMEEEPEIEADETPVKGSRSRRTTRSGRSL